MLAELVYQKEGRCYLFIDGKKESDLALQYLKDQDIDPRVRKSNSQSLKKELERTSRWFANSKRDKLLPTLVIDNTKYVSPISYVSFSGVKSFLREIIWSWSMKDDEEFLCELGKSKFHGIYWKDVKTFYPSRRYDKNKGFRKEQNLVTCFNKRKERIFEGGIEDAPYKIKEQLEKHDYRSWHEVSCWVIGDLEELVNKQNEQCIILDKNTKTVLFPDDVDKLRKRSTIVIMDSRSAYHVHHEAYFMDEEILYGIYAYMFD